MNPSQRDGWPGASGSETGNGYHNEDRSQRPRSTMFGPFGSSLSNNQTSPTSRPGTSSLPPPLGGGHYAYNQNPGHSLPNLPVFPQTSPSQPAQRTPAFKSELHHGSNPFQMSPQRNAYGASGLAQAGQHGHGQQAARNRERENQEQTRENNRHEEVVKREQQDQDVSEVQRSDQGGPHQNHAGSIHLHQPVAVGPQVRTAIHGPNGLLANPAPNIPSASGPPGAPTGLGNIFTSAPPQPDGMQQANTQHQGPMQQSMPPQLGGPPGIPQIAGPALAQGQQPILNDALSYLDQVKVQFVQHPDVYNQFLDIMKDFKGQVIDTPGVIDRVSHLFAGNPNLIQGFNTFLPPGYHIECGAGDEIRVTTPMGTTVNAMPTNSVTSYLLEDSSAGGPRHFLEPFTRASHLPWQQASANMPSDEQMSPNNRPTSQVMTQQDSGALQSHMSPRSAQAQRDQQMADAAAVAHQQEQRGVSQLQNAVSVATNGPVATQRFPQMSPSGDATIPMMLNGADSGMNGGTHIGPEKRGPVEFNHAISYVNKIKNRFSSQPEIYKQFLEILQTYQRESKPIQDVYAQVTLLFNSAPDLLEDFKQFLPESAAQHRLAQAKQAVEDATMLSNVRGDASHQATQPQQMLQTPRSEARLPPVGNFAPTPSLTKDNKRKRTERHGPAASASGPGSNIHTEQTSNAGLRAAQASNANKASRSKQSQHALKQPVQAEVPPVSPTLIPSLPEPMPPSSSTLSVSQDELAFFDRVKKFIGNKNTMNEFLKLCNLFSHDLIDKDILVARVSSFIGGNEELITWFKKFVGWTGRDTVIENRVRPATGRVILSNCRGLGPSYRLLPKEERSKPCSGRDELCNSVLNDEWASHPTWASEDSGFVAHRKNPQEEALHRMEEERHDYDYNIEACERTIQLLEPIAQQLKMMSREDQLSFTLPPGIGGQSETIYKRVIMKLYGRVTGHQVIDALFAQPFQVIPTLLLRCRQKVEEWKASQREWEKVWRESTQKLFWKSLDHQGLNARQADKRQFQTKTLQNEIQVRCEEQKRQKHISRVQPPDYQFEFSFDDSEVVMDASHLLLTYAETMYMADLPRLSIFIKEFIPLFFGLDPLQFQQRVKDVFNSTPPMTYADEDTVTQDEPTSVRSRKVNGKRNDLLRDVLDRTRNGKGVKKGTQDSTASSRASTPEPLPVAEGDMMGSVESFAADSTQLDDGAPRWLDHPQAGDLLSSRDIVTTSPYRRDTFNMYCNLPIYCFFRMFIILYERLCNLKRNEDEVHEAVRRAKAAKPALELRMIDKEPQDFFADTSSGANYYFQMLNMFEDHVKDDHNPEKEHIEDILRRFYLRSGWQMYNFDKMLSALARFGLAILGLDGKDKSWEILQLFKKDRVKEETTHQDELHFRKSVEKHAKDGDIYRIAYNQSSMKAQIQIFRKDDPTFNTSNLSPEAKWSIYISSYITLAPTEGVDHSRVRTPLLKRSLSQPTLYLRFEKTKSEDGGSLDAALMESDKLQDIKSSENLGIRIAVETYRLFAVNDTATAKEWWIHSDRVRRGKDGDFVKGLERLKKARDEAFREKFVENNDWMRGLSKGDVDAKKEGFLAWVGDGKLLGSSEAAGMKEDTEMADV